MQMLLMSLLASGWPAAAQAQGFGPQELEAARIDPKHFTLDEASLRIVPLGRGFAQEGSPSKPEPSTPEGLPGTIDKIINIGAKLWSVVETNRPVVDVRTAWAAAVPEGITHWSQLEGWSRPEATLYGLQAKNLYGVTVVNVRFQVLRTHGGTYKGRGKFLSAVTVSPEQVDVAWGYRFSLQAEIPSVSNVGSSQDPVAGMIADIKWGIVTVLKHSEGHGVYYLQGDGVFRELGGPFKRGFQTDAEHAASQRDIFDRLLRN